MNSIPKPVSYALSAMLVLAIFPLPYGYYTLLRILTTLFCSLSAIVSFKRGNLYLPWVFGAVAVLYNPFIPIYLPRHVWIGINIISLILILSRVNFLALRKETDKSKL
jgi:hypothetical protein